MDSGNTPLARYWPVPPARDLDAALKKRIRLESSGIDPSGLVLRLLDVFHNIGLVSIVLRFVHPDRFGIFSSPVVNLLQIHRPTAVDVYLAFCEELKQWQQHFKMASVAQTEMGLWTYDQIVRHPAETENTAQARQEFEGDIWVQRRRAAQVVRPLLHNYGPLGLARILLEEDPNLAGKIAAEEYERLLRCASLKFYRHPLGQAKGKVEALLESLVRDGHVSQPDGPELRRVWEIRNKAVHPEHRPTAEEIEVMIDRIESICLPWEIPRLKG